MSVIKITPDFDHPLELHTPEYEEVYDPETNATKFVLTTGSNYKARWVRAVQEERSLADSVRISAKTTERLIAYGMDLRADSKEQDAWLEKHPHRKSTQEVNRLPAGMPPIELFKLVHSTMRNDAVVNIPAKYKLTEGLYKTIIDECGEALRVPLMDMELTLGGKKLHIRNTINRNHVKTAYNGLNKEPLPPPDIYTSAVGARLSALLNEYDKQVVKDAAQLRTYITNRLIEISSCGQTKDELRALELLGKISDIGLFTEKSEITVTHTTSASLEHAIKDKINRLLGKNEVDISDADFRPLPKSLVPITLEHREDKNGD